MKKLLMIIPLLCLTIGAFFLNGLYDLIIFLFLIGAVLLFQRKSIKHLLRNILYLIIFTIPLSLMKMILIQEGKKITFGFFSLYSGSLEEVFLFLIRLAVLSAGSFLIGKAGFELDRLKNPPFLDAFVQSIDIYQELIGEFKGLFKKTEKKDRHLAGIIDSFYKRGLK